MADLSRLEEALVKADAAGAEDDARILAAEIRRMRAAPKGGDKLELSKPTLKEKLQASIPGRILQGMRDPIDAGAQLLPRGLEAVTSLGGMAPNPVSKFFGSQGRQVDALNRKNEQDYQNARELTGQSGFDGARLTGGILSPTNALIAAYMPMKAGAGLLGMAGQGAKVGAVGGALQPVDNSDGDFWTNKAAQAGMGAVMGGALAPAMGKAGEALARRINPASTGAGVDVDSVIARALGNMGQGLDDVTSQQLAAVRKQVSDALDSGKTVDATHLLRKSDFDSLGMQGTLGQITRDPTQFAQERNLRGVAGVGEPLMQRFDAQNQRLQKLAEALRGNPSEPYQAGNKIIGSLQGIDDALNADIGKAYAAARDSSGRAAGVNVKQFSDAANDALDDAMLGTYLPIPARKLLNDVSSGKIPLNVNNLVQFDRILSSAQRKAGEGTPEHLALDKVRDALNSADIESSAGIEAKQAFDTARELARNRFHAHKDIRALGSVANGHAVPDNFVQRNVIGGNVDDVAKLAELLKNPGARLKPLASDTPLIPGGALGEAGQAAFQEARDQIGDKLTRAAFGENLTGDKLAAPERLAKALREIGTDKLKTFFSPEEIAQLKTMARVSAYINSTPSAAAVNTSNTAAAAMSLAGKLPGVGGMASLAHALKNAAKNHSTVNKAISGKVPVGAQPKSKLTPDQVRAISRILGLAGASSGSAMGQELK